MILDTITTDDHVIFVYSSQPYADTLLDAMGLSKREMPQYTPDERPVSLRDLYDNQTGERVGMCGKFDTLYRYFVMLRKSFLRSKASA